MCLEIKRFVETIKKSLNFMKLLCVTKTVPHDSNCYMKKHMSYEIKNTFQRVNQAIVG